MKMIDDGLAEKTTAGWGDGWRPIKVAPRDGTCILVYGNRLGDKATEDFISIACWEERGGLAFWASDCTETIPLKPVYWMPLPSPPRM